jgi:hypothetical protein
VEAAILADEVPCSACGYLLRGLNRAGNCPECNQPIAESLLAHANLPTRRSIRRLKAGVIVLAVIVLGWPYVALFAFSDYHWELLGHSLNPDGIETLLYGLLLLVPGWLLGRPGPRRGRIGWLVLALPLLLLVLAAMMFVFIRFYSLVGNALLLSAYAIAPITCTVDLILLLGLLVPHAARIPRGPRTLWVRLAQAFLGGVMLIDDLAALPVKVARILQQLHLMSQPSPDRYVAAGWDAIVRPMYWFTYYALQPARYFTALVLIAYAIILFRRTRFLSDTLSDSKTDQ